MTIEECSSVLKILFYASLLYVGTMMGCLNPCLEVDKNSSNFDVISDGCYPLALHGLLTVGLHECIPCTWRPVQSTNSVLSYF